MTMNRMPLIKSVMTPFPFSVDVGDRIGEAEKMMKEHSIRHLPVKEKGKLVGIITERDLKRTLEPHIGFPSAKDLRVKNVSLVSAYVVDLGMPVDKVVMHMASEHVDSALVVHCGQLVGIFTVTDACQYLGKFLRDLFPSGDSDHAA